MTEEDLIKGRWYFARIDSSWWLFEFLKINEKKVITMNSYAHCMGESNKPSNHYNDYSSLTDVNNIDFNTLQEADAKMIKKFYPNYYIIEEINLNLI